MNTEKIKQYIFKLKNSFLEETDENDVRPSIDCISATFVLKNKTKSRHSVKDDTAI